MALLDITGGGKTSLLSQSTASPATQTAPIPDAFVSASTAQKLDADYYAATEVGDSSESLSGSGNLNYATLQAQQNDLLSLITPQEPSPVSQDLALGSLAYGLSVSQAAALIAENLAVAPTTTTVENTAPASAIPSSATITESILFTAGTNTSTSNAVNTTLGDVFDTAPRIETGGGNNAAGSNGTTGPAGPAGQPGNNGTNGNNGMNGNNGNNGDNGSDGNTGGHDTVCCGPTIIDIDITGPIINGPVINGPLVDIGDITQITHNLIHTVAPVINILPPVIAPVITNITNVLDGLLTPPSAGEDTDLIIDLGVADTPLLGDTLHVGVDIVESLIGDIDVNTGIEGVLQGGATTITLDGHALGLDLPPIDITLPVTVETLLTDPVGSVADIVADLPQTVETVLGSVTDILAPPPQGDTDLSVDLGIADVPVLDDTLHIGLDIVESLIGDIDVNTGIEGVLQGDATTITLDGHALGLDLPPVDITLPVTVETLLTDPAGSVGDIVTELPQTVETVLGGVSDILATPAAGTDSDLTIDLGIGNGIHIPLDIVEGLSSDLDINVDLNLDTVNDALDSLASGTPVASLGDTLGDLLVVDATGDGVLGGLLGGSTDHGAWPTTPGPVENIVDSVLGGVTDGNILAPVGSVSEGLGLLDLGGGGLLGGDGGGKSGGLFGGLFG